MRSSESNLQAIKLPKFVTVRNLPPWFVEAMDNLFEIPNIATVTVTVMTKDETQPTGSQFQFPVKMTYDIHARY